MKRNGYHWIALGHCVAGAYIALFDLAGNENALLTIVCISWVAVCTGDILSEIRRRRD